MSIVYYDNYRLNNSMGIYNIYFSSKYNLVNKRRNSYCHILNNSAAYISISSQNIDAYTIYGHWIIYTQSLYS